MDYTKLVPGMYVGYGSEESWIFLRSDKDGWWWRHPNGSEGHCDYGVFDRDGYSGFRALTFDDMGMNHDQPYYFVACDGSYGNEVRHNKDVTCCSLCYLVNAEVHEKYTGKNLDKPIPQDIWEPVPGPCLRVRALEMELKEDYENSKGGGLLWPEALTKMKVFIDKWYPRRQELKDCGDCPNCLKRAEQQEAKPADPVYAGDRSRQSQAEASIRYGNYIRDDILKKVFGK